MSMETNAKLFALRETIAMAIKDGNLESKMDVLKLQAVELGVDEKALNDLIEGQKKQVQKQNKVLQIVKEKKGLLWTICLVVVIIEWAIGLSIAIPSNKVNEDNNTVVQEIVEGNLAMDTIAYDSINIDNSEITNVKTIESQETENVVDASSQSFSFSSIIWILLVNLLTILVIIFGLAYVLNKKVK